MPVRTSLRAVLMRPRGAAAESSLLTNMVSHWGLDGDGNDAHGTNDLTNTGGNVGFPRWGNVRDTGEHLLSASFNNTSTKELTVADNASLSIDGESFMVAGWFKPNGDGTVQALINKDSSSSDRAFQLVRHSAGFFQFQVYDSSGSGIGFVRDTFSISTNKWYLVIAWWDADNDTANIQVSDGDRSLRTAQSAATSGTVGPTTAAFNIGKEPSGSFNGNSEVQAVSFWKGGFLSASERTELFNGGYGLPYPFNGSPFASNETGVSPLGYGAIAPGNPNAVIHRWLSMASIGVSGTRYQVVGFWNSLSKMVLGKRDDGGTGTWGAWTLYTYDGTGGLSNITLSSADNHKNISLGFDPDGVLHIAYDHHNTALKYRRSDAAITSWTGGLTATQSMLGTNETEVTYPTFFNDPTGSLYWIHRSKTNGGGDNYMYAYDESTTSWSAASGTGTDGLLMQGGSNVIYWDYPIFESTFGSGGHMHLSYLWRGSGTEGWDYGHIKWDGTDWYKTDGTSQTIPLTSSNDTPFDTDTTILNTNNLDLDSNNLPHIAYFKDDGTQDQLYHAHYNGSSWTITKLTTTSGTDAFNGTAGTDWAGRPVVIVDRTTDTVYILYRDDTDVDGILRFTSGAGDFATWTQDVFYEFDGGPYEPAYDRNYYESDGIVHLVYAPTNYTAGTPRHITVLEWEP